MKRKSPFVLLLFACIIAKAQTVQPSVIASAGNYSAFSGGSIQWTIGEVVTETATSGSHSFTQGFNQPDSSSLLTGVNKIGTPQFTISGYPNPVINNLSVTFSAIGIYVLDIYTIDGKKLTEYTVTGSSEPMVIPFSKYPEGMYMVTVINAKTSQKSSFKVIKSN
jgi:hypothetical protein